VFRRSSEDSSRWHTDEQPPEHLACLASSVGKGSLSWRGGPKSVVLCVVEDGDSWEDEDEDNTHLHGRG
jgi:hypothetical protein